MTLQRTDPAAVFRLEGRSTMSGYLSRGGYSRRLAGCQLRVLCLQDRQRPVAVAAWFTPGLGHRRHGGPPDGWTSRDAIYDVRMTTRRPDDRIHPVRAANRKAIRTSTLFPSRAIHVRHAAVVLCAEVEASTRSFLSKN